MYVITGATGHIGQALAEILLDRGEHVRAIARVAAQLQPLAAKGAEPLPGDLGNTPFLISAFRRAAGVFVMIPPNPQAPDFRAYQNRIGAATAAALLASGVTRVVNLSALGAHLPRGNGPMGGLYDQEQRLNSLANVNVLHLRPAFFMENLTMHIGKNRDSGTHGSPLRGDLRLPMVATRDIAHAAADGLTARSFTGKVVQELLGQRDVSMREATAILAHAIGPPRLFYDQLGYDEARQAMVAEGISEDLARLLVEMYQGFNDGVLLRGIVRTAENTTPTSFEDFAAGFARQLAA